MNNNEVTRLPFLFHQAHAVVGVCAFLPALYRWIFYPKEHVCQDGTLVGASPQEV